MREVPISWSERVDGVSGSLDWPSPIGVVLLLVFEGAEVAQALLDASGVVEPVEVLEQREVGLGPGGEDAAAHALSIHRFSARALSYESPTDPMDP